MVKNLLPGPDWIPTTMVVMLGPLIFNYREGTSIISRRELSVKILNQLEALMTIYRNLFTKKWYDLKLNRTESFLIQEPWI